MKPESFDERHFEPLKSMTFLSGVDTETDQVRKFLPPHIHIPKLGCCMRMANQNDNLNELKGACENNLNLLSFLLSQACKAILGRVRVLAFY